MVPSISSIYLIFWPPGADQRHDAGPLGAGNRIDMERAGTAPATHHIRVSLSGVLKRLGGQIKSREEGRWGDHPCPVSIP